MDERTTSTCWNLASVHFSPQEATDLRRHEAAPLPGTPWLSGRHGRVVVAVHEEADPELPVHYPCLAACLAEARRLGFEMISFAPGGARVDTLPVHESGADSPGRSLAARRRLWLLRAIASEIDVTGFEVQYAALRDAVARTAYEQRVLLVQPRGDDAHPARLTLHPDRSAAARDLEENGNVANLGDAFVVDLETWTRSRAVPAVRWERTDETFDIALLCPRCGNEDVSSADALLATALGGWVQRGTERVFEGVGESDMQWDTQTPEHEDEPCFCRDCEWSGSRDSLVPEYQWEGRKESSGT